MNFRAPSRDSKTSATRRLLVLLATSAAATGCALAPTSASAALDCSRTGGVLSIEMSAEGDWTILTAKSDTLITVHQAGNNPPIDCEGGGANTTNIDRIELADTSAGGSTRVTMQNAPGLAPGASTYGDGGINAREIEVDVDLGAGREDSLFLAGGPGDDAIVAGAEGINFNAELEGIAPNDRDVTLAGVEAVRLDGQGGTDLVSAEGGFDVGAPLGGDVGLSAGEGVPGEVERILGGPGSGLIYASANATTEIDAGAGADEVGAGGVEVDVDLGPGNDEFKGNSLDSIVTGGPGADLLIGEEGSDRLSGGFGRDRLLGGEGEDLLLARDRTRDRRINCGEGADRVRADRRLDPRAGSCES